MSKGDQKYEITILNWDKYQPEMKGDGSRRRRRSFIAISVDLFSDPDFLAMDQMHRTAWVAMLCHAGKVGPRYELCPSDARLLFRLRRSPDFEVFRNQGFIDLQNPTNKTDKTNNIYREKSEKKTGKKASKRVPASWSLTDNLADYGREQGMSESTLKDEVENFRDYEYKSAKTDFDGCWRTWCRNWKKFGGKSEPVSRARPL